MNLRKPTQSDVVAAKAAAKSMGYKVGVRRLVAQLRLTGDSEEVRAVAMALNLVKANGKRPDDASLIAYNAGEIEFCGFIGE